MFKNSFKLLTLLVILYTLPLAKSQAHSWYDPSCCSDTDCHPIDSCSELIELPNGNIRWGDKEFSKDRIKPSQDGKCHVCIGTYGTPYCVYIQLGT